MQSHGTDVVIWRLNVIGVLWLAVDRLVFREIERVTVRRWDQVQDI